MRARVIGFALLASACSKSSAAPGPGDAEASVDASDAGLDGWPLEPRAPSTLALHDIVGIAGNPPHGTDPASVNQRAFFWSKLAEAGIHRVRGDFTWSDIEPTRGTFDFSAYDLLVADAAAHGIDLLAILDYGNPWATSVSGADDHYPPDNPQDFATYAAAVATHFQGKVHEYEIWNEPNVGFRFWKPTLNGDPVKFGALVLAATQAMAQADPSAAVAYGGTAYMTIVRGPDFVARSLAATPGLATAFNTFAMHAYSIYPPFRGPESTVAQEVPELDKIATMSGMLDVNGAPKVPIWITEIGWPTMDDDPADQQARYVARSVLLGALGGADRVFLFTLSDGPNPEAYPPEDAFGLVDYNPDWIDGGLPPDKPAFVAVKALLGALGGYAVMQRLPASPDDVYLVSLSDGTRSAWAAWRSFDGVPSTPVTLPAMGPVTVTHVDGSVTNDTAPPGGYVLSVGPDPVFVTTP